jgi:hypothetical protein
MDPDYDQELDVNTWLERDTRGSWVPDTEPEPGLDLSTGYDPVIGNPQDAQDMITRVTEKLRELELRELE